MLPSPTPKKGAICGSPATCILKSLNISLECPETAWQETQPALPKNRSPPFFCGTVIALT